jgi:hypothetical protein
MLIAESRRFVMLSDWEHETLPVLARILALEDRRARLAATRRRSLWSRARQRPLNPTQDLTTTSRVPAEV